MAHIYKHGEKWRAQVAKNGVRKSAVWDTKREALEWANRVELEIESLKRQGLTFGQAVSEYLAEISIKKESPDWERRRFAAMLEYFGADTPLGEITSKTISKWRNHRLQSVAGATVLREANLLRNLFTIARDEWLAISENPFKGVKLPDESEARTATWGWREIRRILRAGQQTGGKTQEATEAFHIALRTAMRQSEALAAPAHFDPRRQVVTLPKDKTHKKAVEIPVGRIAAKLLSRPPFTVGANQASTLFSRLCKAQMISGLTFHDARATALTLLAKKVDVMVLARISRHKDIALLHRVYYRASSEEIARRL